MNRVDLQAPTLVRPPQANLGYGPLAVQPLENRLYIYNFFELIIQGLKSDYNPAGLRADSRVPNFKNNRTEFLNVKYC